eukprot:Gb_41538 [translate_table: standard]
MSKMIDRSEQQVESVQKSELQKTAWKQLFSNILQIAPTPRCLLFGLLSLQLIIFLVARGLPASKPWVQFSSRSLLSATPVPYSLPPETTSNLYQNVNTSDEKLKDAETVQEPEQNMPRVQAMGNEDRSGVLDEETGLAVDTQAEMLDSAKEKHRSLNSDQRCELGRVFVYELPSIFNSELLENCHSLSPWTSMCPAIANSGMGQPIQRGTPGAGAWYMTDEFCGEIIFHRRMREHPCRTDKPERATAFYVPFYAGMSVGRYLWSNYSASDRDRDCRKLLEWVGKQKYWRRNSGLDHFMMLGRITWDFRRLKDGEWGSNFLHMPGIQNSTRLVIERNPWDDKEIGVPYPTAFHPRNSDDVLRWQDYLRNVERKTLFSFAGKIRKSNPNDDFRISLLDQCREAQSCRSLNCNGSHDSMAAVELFLGSTFCLQPRGDGFTRRSIFDCLVAGSIPVFFWRRSAYWQYKWHFPSEASSYSVFISRVDVRNGTRIEDVLRAVSAEKVQSLRENVINSIPRFVYVAPGHRLENMRDAFDIAVDAVLERINSTRLQTLIY